MRWFVTIIAGVAVAFVWLTFWAFVLRAFGIPVFRRTPEERDSRRERLKRMGKFRYVLIFGVLGPGVGFGLALITAELLDHNSHGWAYAATKLAALSVLFGWFHGARTWNEAFRDPVPFPPKYAPPK